MKVMPFLSRKLDAHVIVPCGAGQLHLLGWPGLRTSHIGDGWIDPEDRREILDRMVHSGCRDLFALVEARELPPGTKAGLRKATAQRGIILRSAPILDYHPPGMRFMRRWSALLHHHAGAVQAGGQLAFCCLAGAGRSGTMSALVLAMTGMPVDQAIARIRHANPDAIESPAQEDWLSAQGWAGAVPAKG